ncbi:MAG: bifunctional adenosylcobinamide kinase/adenosylcobinamide-phosphate guanylyltransferase [Propioniciclava sp.]
MMTSDVMPTGGRLIVVGPARSGKSRWAEGVLSAEPAVDYVATSAVPADDPEWAQRVRIHRRRRPSHWRTVETTDLVGVLSHGTVPVLIDCLAVWLARAMDTADVWNDAPGSVDRVTGEIDRFLAALRTTGRRVVIVSNEVGAGVVPSERGTRCYRDLLGTLNAQVGAVCDEIWLCQVGVARRWR